MFRIFITSLLVVGIMITGPATAENYLNQPEGIAFDSLNNRWLISNWANGAIIQIDSNGVQDYFKTGLGNCACKMPGGKSAGVRSQYTIK